ncbi:MAG: hypothetical protein IJ781_12535, partial [Atopobiaceae bacterium]|nr:hypothetical protein [Atopobiaceae bacterium]
EGLVVDRVFNGEGDERVELVQDGEGNYILEVPASGNINLSALFRQEETPEPEPEPAPTPEPTPAPVPSVDPAPARATSPAQKALPATGDESAAWGVTVTALGGCLVIAGALCRLRSTDEEAA